MYQLTSTADAPSGALRARPGAERRRRAPTVAHEMVRPGAFVAGVGADNENKQELDPLLLARSKLVTDLTEQCCAIGDLHHAVAAGIMSRADVHAELGEVAAGLKAARTSDEEVIVFDSSGTALQDVAAAAAVYRRAIEDGEGTRFSFNARFFSRRIPCVTSSHRYTAVPGR